MASLYELSAEYADLMDAYDAAETEEEREEVLARLNLSADEIVGKAEDYAKLVRMKEEEAKGFKAEAERLTKRKQAAENLVARLKATMLDAMTLTGQTEVNTSIGKWRKQMNPPSCDVLNVDLIPKQYRIPQPDKVDKKSILDAFKQTGEIPSGVEIKREEGVRFR